MSSSNDQNKSVEIVVSQQDIEKLEQILERFKKTLSNNTSTGE